MRQTHERELRDILRRVRRRWLAVSAAHTLARTATALALVVFAATAAERLWQPQPFGLVWLGAVVIVLAVVVAGSLLWPLGRVPKPAEVARFVEERCPELQDRLVSATYLASSSPAGMFDDLMVADAAGRAAALDLERVVGRSQVWRALATAVAAAAVLVVSAFTAGDSARRAGRAALLYGFPATVQIRVSPGDTRLAVGERFRIIAEVRAPFGLPDGVRPVVEIASEQPHNPTPVPAAGAQFAFEIPSISTSFTYRVRVGSVASPVYRVTALHPPRVARIDLEYEYPAFTGLPRRTEEDGGDIYAPEGTRVRLRVHADKPVRAGTLAIGHGRALSLARTTDRALESTLQIAEDGSYRVSLVDEDGLTATGETEYFIRVMDDGPPSVRIVRPAGDRQVTPLEEVAVEARADDDYGLERLDLVYSVRGGAERVVPLGSARQATSHSGLHVFFLEDLKVQPGDFVAYYARARDVSRGKRSSEARSDIYFLEVKPFEEEFAAAQSMAGMGGSAGNMGDLAAAQKEIIIATWKLDRRAAGGKSEADIKAVARAQAELRQRAQQASGVFQRFGRDPRQGRPGGPRPPQPDNPIGRAVAAMGRAEAALDTLKTGEALPHEMEALNELLKAEAEMRRRQVARGQGSGGGSGRPGQDLSALFDRELQRQQQTNYETRSRSNEPEEAPESEALQRVRELARRQDALSEAQRELARRMAEMSPEELKRQLERLTREQTELRRQAEELRRQLANQQDSRSARATGERGQNETGSRSQNESGAGSTGQGERLRDASEEMRGATSDLRRQDVAGAAARSDRAAGALRDLERQMRDGQPDERRRALGELQLESRQLAQAERHMANETRHLAPDQPGTDLRRRLAGERERLAERVDRLQRGVSELARSADGTEQSGLEAAGRELQERALGRRLRESASDLRNEDEAGGKRAPGRNEGKPSRVDPRQVAQADEEMARSLDRVAEHLGAAAGDQARETAQLSEDLNRARELRDRLGEIEQKMKARGQAQASSGGNRAGRGEQDSTDDQLAKLRDEYLRELQKAEGLLDGLRREHPELERQLNAVNGTQSTRSAPGTEAFKQDFAAWEVLKREVELALEKYETIRSRELAEKELQDRLNAGGSNEMPPEYRRLVEQYYRLLAARKKQP